MDPRTQSYRFYFFDQLWHSNQILVAILGICSALAVTTSVGTAVTMGVAVTFVTACSSFIVSLLRHWTPDNVRMITQLVVISVFVTVVDLFLKAYAYNLSKTLSVFVGLIITNCLVMGRAEGMAKSVKPWPAFFDGAGAGMGYALVLLFVGACREFFGAGTLAGFRIIPNAWYATAAHPDAYSNFNIMILSPGAFFLLGGMIWIANIVKHQEGV